MARIDELLRYLKQQRGSDLHLAAGEPARIRVSGSLRPIQDVGAIPDEKLVSWLQEIVSPEQWSDYERVHELDFAYGLAGLARFRCNYFGQQRGAGAVFRVIPERIMSLEDLNLPPVVGKLALLSSGLVLVTGPTGSGKSTTLAAIIDRINTTVEKHIITIEDPIEFVHQNKRSVLSQREVGTHTKSFGAALRASIRQNPDIVLVGEMRDRETITLAITAAEMGLLVFGTLHTNNAVKSVDRLIDAVPVEEQEQVRLSLSQSLAAIVSQILVQTTDGKGRRAAVEVLLRTKSLPNIIREGNTVMLGGVIQQGKKSGMIAMDDSLMELVKSKQILPITAYHKAADKTRFEKLIPAD